MQCGTITRKLNSVFDELSDAFGPMYTLSDFKKKVARLMTAKSERQQILGELYEMFDDCGVEYEINQGNSYYQKLVEELKLPHFTDVEAAARYAIETAKDFGTGKCSFYDEEEFERAVKRYGSMAHLQTMGKDV